MFTAGAQNTIDSIALIAEEVTDSPKLYPTQLLITQRDEEAGNNSKRFEIESRHTFIRILFSVVEDSSDSHIEKARDKAIDSLANMLKDFSVDNGYATFYFQA